jgi:hypothetical protein
MKLTERLVLSLGLAGVMVPLGATAQLPAPETSKAVAFQRAKTEGKLVMMVVSDTNSCTICSTLLFGVLPVLSEFVNESFVYWACGPEQRCTEYPPFIPEDSLNTALPATSVIDPWKATTYVDSMKGTGQSTNYFKSFLAMSVLKVRGPIAVNVPEGTVVRTNNVVLNGRSWSTNAAIKSVYYRVNNAPTWTKTVASNLVSFTAALDPAQVVLGANTVNVYALDSRGVNISATNTIHFVYNPNGGPSYTVSGRVSTPAGVGIPNATILTNGAFAALTDGNGNYAISVGAGWSGEVSATNVNYTMTPSFYPVSSVSGSVPAVDFMAQVMGAPKVAEISPPVLRNAGNHSDLPLSVSATGDNLTYQWYFKGQALAGATSSNYVITSFGADSAGAYLCVVSNPLGVVTSTVPVFSASVITVPAFKLNGPTNISLNLGLSYGSTPSSIGTNALPLSFMATPTNRNVYVDEWRLQNLGLTTTSNLFFRLKQLP